MKHSIVYLLAVIFSTITARAQKEEFLVKESLLVDSTKYVSATKGITIYNYFKDSNLFNWNDYNNCEDRANAMCILLDAQKIPNYKAWVFSGGFLKKDNGLLTNRYGVRWKYHVATIIPISDGELFSYIVLDPSTTSGPVSIAAWSDNVTDKPHGYYFITDGNKYIWKGKGKDIGRNAFFERNRTNYHYTIEGLAGFNGLSRKDRVAMRSETGKRKLIDIESKFNDLKSASLNFDK